MPYFSRWSLVAALGLFALARSAHAADGQADERSADVGARLSPILFAPAYTAGVGALIGLEGRYHLSPALRVGAYGQFFELRSTSSDQLEYEAAETQGARFGALFELHLWPTGTWDPWLGVSVGGFSVRRGKPDSDAAQAGTGAGLDASAELGLDIHVGRVAFGPLLYGVMPLTNRPLFNDGGYVSLIPSVRAHVAF